MEKEESKEESKKDPSKGFKTIDLMLDLETLGICDDPVITQISAIAFSLETGAQLDTFNERIGTRNSLVKGFKVDGSTIEWWSKQSEKVYNEVFIAAFTSDIKIEDVLHRFTNWINNVKSTYGRDYKTNINVWGNGALADNKWIRQAYKLCGMEVPWHYTEDRDVRTLVDLGRRTFNYDYKNVVFEGEVHNAIDDCKHQIKYCCEVYDKIKNKIQ